ncbi:MAG TPA: SPOR domain-containing protein [Chitinophagaceae bacterium]|nr:SPOR domain-containing protein [Chitinophagaceae bacterium]
MKQRISYIILFIAIGSYSNAQDSSGAKPFDSVSVIVHKDPRLDMLVKKQAQINEETSRDARKAGKGFRLMIVNTNNRDEAIAAKTKIYTHFPELKAYLFYQSPYFKLKVGNFKERKDAEAYQKRLNIYFPKGVFIMKDNIEIKGKQSEDDTI